MHSRTTIKRYAQTSRLCLSLLSAAAILGATTTPASALLITSQIATSTADEVDSLNGVVSEAKTQTSSSFPADAKVQLGDGKNAFNKATFAEAFSTFHGNIPTYWVHVNGDNLRSQGDLGRGEANVNIEYTAIKQAGDRAFTLNVSGGAMHLADPDGGMLPLDATATLEVLISSGQSTLRDVLATARLHGNGGSFANQTFDLDARGFDFTTNAFVLEDDGGNNIVGVHTELPKMKIPVDLDGITDGTALNINIQLFATANAEGGETEAEVFLRDPAHVDDSNPLNGGSSITIETKSVTGVPEPSGLALFASALFAFCFFRRGKALVPARQSRHWANGQ